MITPDNSCVGCGACEQICPKGCISMLPDKEGFLFPQVNSEICIGCNLCEKVCPRGNSVERNTIKEGYAAFNQDTDIRRESSSGGVFSVLAQTIIEQGGVVFGAALNSKMEVVHTAIETVDGLEKLRGSKYVQSKIGSSYANAKEFLKTGRLVYFSGTPCQVAGLYSFLGDNYSNLITQDVICHGVPSPLVWEKYVKYREKKAVSKINRVDFRSKKSGWKSYSVRFSFSNQKEYCEFYQNDCFMRLFLNNFILRSSCYECLFKGTERFSDITLADFWGIDKVLPDFDDDYGCSLVLIHSKKGQRVFENVRERLTVKSCDVDTALQYNPSAVSSVKLPKKRNRTMRFFRRLDFERAYKKTFSSSFFNQILNKLRWLYHYIRE